VTMIGWAIYWFLSRTTPSKRAGYRKAPRSLASAWIRLGEIAFSGTSVPPIWYELTDRQVVNCASFSGTSVPRPGAKLQIESSSQPPSLRLGAAAFEELPARRGRWPNNQTA
jgi:hypothetical protein